MDAYPSEILTTVVLSITVACCAVLISCILGIPFGVWLGFGNTRSRSFVRAMVYSGMAMPPVVIGLFLYLILSRSGPLGGWQWLFTAKAMVLAQVILDLPFVVGITMTAVGAVPRDLGFQLQALGASPWQIRWTMLTEIRHSLVLAAATAMGRSLSEVGAVLMVGGNIAGHTRVMTTAIVLETNRGRFTVALTLGAILLSLALIMNLVMVRIQDRHPQ